MSVRQRHRKWDIKLQHKTTYIMKTLTKDEVSNMKLMMDVYIQSINADLDNAEMDGETLMKVLTMTTNLTMLNAMTLAEMKETENAKE